MHVHFNLTADVPVMDIFHSSGDISSCSAWGDGSLIEVDVYYVGEEFILAKDDTSHMAIPKKKLLMSIENREYWETELSESL